MGASQFVPESNDLSSSAERKHSASQIQYSLARTAVDTNSSTVNLPTSSGYIPSHIVSSVTQPSFQNTHNMSENILSDKRHVKSSPHDIYNNSISYSQPIQNSQPTNYSQQLVLSRLPTPTPRQFGGDALQFPSWKTYFETLIVQSGMPAKERLYYLAECLNYNSDPWKGIQGYFTLSSDSAYYEAMAQLESRYGNKYIIAAAFRKELDRWPKIYNGDHLGLRRLADFAK